MGRRVVIDLPAASGLLSNQSGCLLFYAVRETSGAAAAAVKFYDGSDAAGKLLLPIGLASGASDNGGLVKCVLPFRQGLYYDLATGAVEGAVSVLLDHQCEVWRAEVEQQLAQLVG